MRKAGRLLLVLAPLALGPACARHGETTWQGDLAIADDAAWAAFVGRRCTTLTGELRLGPAVTAAASASLRQITGSLLVEGASTLSALELPALRGVEGTVTVRGAPALASLSLPALVEAGGLDLRDDHLLSTIDLPALTSLRGEFRVEDDPRLDQCDPLALLGRLRSAGFQGRARVTDLARGPGLECAAGLPCQGAGTWFEFDYTAAYLEARACSEIAGGASILATSPASLTLPDLARVDGPLTVWNAFTSLAMPSLVQVDGPVRLDAPLASLDLGSLTTAQGLWLRGASLQALRLPALQRLAGRLDVTDNPGLTTLDLPQLSGAGLSQVIIAGNPALGACDARAFVTALRARGLQASALAAGNDEVQGCRQAGVCGPLDLASDADVVAAAGCTEATGDVTIQGTALGAIDLPALARVAGTLTVTGNASLSHLGLPALTSASALAVAADPLLQPCDVAELLGRLRDQGFGGPASISDLGSTAACVGARPCEGVTISSAADLAAFQARGCTELTGDLRIQNAPDVVEVSLPVLRRAVGIGLLDNPALARVDLPSLVAADSLTVGFDPALEHVAAPVLAAARSVEFGGAPLRFLGLDRLSSVGELAVSGTALVALRLPALAASSGDLRLSGNALLAALGLPALGSVGGLLMIDGNELSAGDQAPRLTVVRALEVGGNGGLAELRLPALAAISAPSQTGTPGASAGIFVNVNPALTRLSLPVLGTLTERAAVRGNSALTQFDLPALIRVWSTLDVEDNPRLPQCAVDSLASRLQADWACQVVATGNDPVATCP